MIPKRDAAKSRKAASLFMTAVEQDDYETAKKAVMLAAMANHAPLDEQLIAFEIFYLFFSDKEWYKANQIITRIRAEVNIDARG